MSFYSTEQTPASSGGVAAVDRALSILAAFSDRSAVLALNELAHATGLYKSTILRLLGSLERAGYIRRLADGRYSVGPEPLRLGRAYQSSFRIADLVVPALQRLVEQSGETASFYIRDGNERVCLHRVEPDRVVRLSVSEGDRFPLDRGASGKLILAFDGAKGPAMEEIRGSFCAYSVGERDPETASVACPIFGQRDVFMGALNISGPRVRLTARKQRECKTILLKEAASLSAGLGADVQHYENFETAAVARR